MQRFTKGIFVAAGALGMGLGGYGLASAATAVDTAPAEADEANEASDSETPLTGSDLDQAVAAALEHTGGGEVLESETGDDGAAYGVEIRLPDGSQVEVNLDADFAVIGSEADAD